MKKAKTFQEFQQFISISSDSESASPAVSPAKRKRRSCAVVSPVKSGGGSTTHGVSAPNMDSSPITISDVSEIESSPHKERPCRQLFTDGDKKDYKNSHSEDDLPDLDENARAVVNEKEFTDFYEEDKSLPIYKSLKFGISTKEVVQVLLRKLKHDQVAKNIPYDIDRNVSFVYSINAIGGHWKNALCDGMGRWNQNGKQANYLNVTDKGDVDIIQNPFLQENNISDNLMVIRRKYTNMSYSKLHRVVILLENKASSEILDQMFVQYYFEGQETPVTVASHGNSTKTTAYQRTTESAKNRIKELCAKKTKPKEVFHTLIEDQGGIKKTKGGVYIARDRQQVRNFGRKLPQYRDTVIECVDLAKRQEKTDDRFLREVRAAPEFSMFLSSNRQLRDIEKFCTDDKNMSVLGIDTTFNIGEYYVTITTYRHLMMENTHGVEPVMIGPILVHQRKTFDSYFKLPSSMLQDCPGLKNLSVFGTDGDVNLANSFEVCYPQSYHLLCDIHMVDNLERKLQKLSIRGNAAKQYIRDIFGEVHGQRKSKGLIDCLSHDILEEKMNELKDEWIARHENGKAFLEYFIEHKLDLIKNCTNADVRSRCGLGFPPKPYTQNGNECINAVLKSDILSDARSKDRKLDPYEFAKRAETFVRRQENELRLAVIRKGEYRLKQQYQHLEVEENLYWRKSESQREAVFQRYELCFIR